jgi:hypothetical protein
MLLASTATITLAQNRTIDGSGNNVANPTWGSVDVQLGRLGPVTYQDGISVPRGGDPSSLPSPRAVSNAVVAQPGSILNNRNLSDWVWQWGQFMDHDLDLTDVASPAEPFNIPVPTGDPFFDPGSTGTQTIALNRSMYDPSTGTGPGNPRQQINQITSWIDASNVYGSDATRAAALRTMSGGKLATSAGNLMPFNTGGLPNGGGTGSNLFLAGDPRSNEQIGLTAVHTLFVREHNRVADLIEAANPGAFSDEQIYQQARKVVGAELQIVTYNEFLPALLGSNAISPYAGYNSSVDGTVANEFANAAYRIGHTMLSPTLLRRDNNGNVIGGGDIDLRDAFFAPTEITDWGIEPLLKGLSMQQMQEIDNMIVDDVRNFLFGPPGSGGFDLASLNMQRGRDHGLPSYNQARVAMGLSAAVDWLDVTGGDAALAAALASVYASVDDIDLWIGGLCEPHEPGGSVGELLTAIIADQFERVRDGDRFWWENDSYFDTFTLFDLENVRLSDVIMWNSNITNLQSNVFFVPEPGSLALLALGAAAVIRRRR